MCQKACGSVQLPGRYSAEFTLVIRNLCRLGYPCACNRVLTAASAPDCGTKREYAQSAYHASRFTLGNSRGAIGGAPLISLSTAPPGHLYRSAMVSLAVT